MQKSKPVPGSASASAWQCSALCKAQVKAYLGVFRVTVNSPSVTRIHLLAISYFEVFIYSAAEECYTVQFFTVDANNNVHTYDCMRIALSLRVHHRAQRLFTIPLRGSAINTEQLCQSIRRFQNFTVRRAISCPYCTVGSRLRTDHRCCRAICPYCTVGSFGRHFLLNVMWHGFDQSHFKYILRCYIIKYMAHI